MLVLVAVSFMKIFLRPMAMVRDQTRTPELEESNIQIPEKRAILPPQNKTVEPKPNQQVTSLKLSLFIFRFFEQKKAATVRAEKCMDLHKLAEAKGR